MTDPIIIRADGPPPPNEHKHKNPEGYYNQRIEIWKRRVHNYRRALRELHGVLARERLYSVWLREALDRKEHEVRQLRSATEAEARARRIATSAERGNGLYAFLCGLALGGLAVFVVLSILWL